MSNRLVTRESESNNRELYHEKMNPDNARIRLPLVWYRSKATLILERAEEPFPDLVPRNGPPCLYGIPKPKPPQSVSPEWPVKIVNMTRLYAG